MLAKRLLFKTDSNSSDNLEKYGSSEKMKSMEGEEMFKARSDRKRHSVQLDKRITLQLQERRQSSTSTGTNDSMCKCCITCHLLYLCRHHQFLENFRGNFLYYYMYFLRLANGLHLPYKVCEILPPFFVPKL